MLTGCFIATLFGTPCHSARSVTTPRTGASDQRISPSYHTTSATRIFRPGELLPQIYSSLHHHSFPTECAVEVHSNQQPFRFIPHCATILSLLNALLKSTATNSRSLQWTITATSAFEEIKDALAKTTLLVHPKSDAPINVMTDASDVAIGAVK